MANKKMDYEQVVAWLSRYRDIEQKIALLRLRKERISSYAQRMTVAFENSIQSGGKRQSRIELATEAMDALDREVQKLLEEKGQYQRETQAALKKIKNPEYRRFMQYYYVECLTWITAAELTGYSERHLRRIHKKVIQSLVDAQR